MASKKIQEAIHRALADLFGADLVHSEWSVRKRAADTFREVASYAPRLDIAVGPFNTTREGRHRDADAICNFEHPLVCRLKQEVAAQNHGSIYHNPNPRCLLAVEIEHSTSSKHVLGAITNASMLGLLGVLVGSAQHIKKVRRIHTYACKLKEVEKAHDDMFANVACFEDCDFLELLQKVQRQIGRKVYGDRSRHR
jgi:hypothetical protein